MTKEEAQIVAGICCTADGECVYCAKDLIKQLTKAFPEHRETFDKEIEKM